MVRNTPKIRKSGEVLTLKVRVLPGGNVIDVPLCCDSVSSDVVDFCSSAASLSSEYALVANFGGFEKTFHAEERLYNLVRRFVLQEGEDQRCSSVSFTLRKRKKKCPPLLRRNSLRTASGLQRSGASRSPPPDFCLSETGAADFGESSTDVTEILPPSSSNSSFCMLPSLVVSRPDSMAMTAVSCESIADSSSSCRSISIDNYNEDDISTSFREAVNVEGCGLLGIQKAPPLLVGDGEQKLRYQQTTTTKTTTTSVIRQGQEPGTATQSRRIAGIDDLKDSTKVDVMPRQEFGYEDTTLYHQQRTDKTCDNFLSANQRCCDLDQVYAADLNCHMITNVSFTTTVADRSPSQMQQNFSPTSYDELFCRAQQQKEQIALNNNALRLKEIRLKAVKQQEVMASHKALSERLRMLRDRVACEEARMQSLHELRGSIETHQNSVLTEESEIESSRDIITRKEAELSRAVARVEELAHQLELLKLRTKTTTEAANNRGSPQRHAELEKFKQELVARSKRNEESRRLLKIEQQVLAKRQVELMEIDQQLERASAKIIAGRKESANLQSSQLKQQEVMEPLTTSAATLAEPATLSFQAKPDPSVPDFTAQTLVSIQLPMGPLLPFNMSRNTASSSSLTNYERPRAAVEPFKITEPGDESSSNSSNDEHSSPTPANCSDRNSPQTILKKTSSVVNTKGYATVLQTIQEVLNADKQCLNYCSEPIYGTRMPPNVNKGCLPEALVNSNSTVRELEFSDIRCKPTLAVSVQQKPKEQTYNDAAPSGVSNCHLSSAYDSNESGKAVQINAMSKSPSSQNNCSATDRVNASPAPVFHSPSLCRRGSPLLAEKLVNSSSSSPPRTASNNYIKDLYTRSKEQRTSTALYQYYHRQHLHSQQQPPQTSPPDSAAGQSFNSYRNSLCSLDDSSSGGSGSSKDQSSDRVDHTKLPPLGSAAPDLIPAGERSKLASGAHHLMKGTKHHLPIDTIAASSANGVRTVVEPDVLHLRCDNIRAAKRRSWAEHAANSEAEAIRRHLQREIKAGRTNINLSSIFNGGTPAAVEPVVKEPPSYLDATKQRKPSEDDSLTVVCTTPSSTEKEPNTVPRTCDDMQEMVETCRYSPTDEDIESTSICPPRIGTESPVDSLSSGQVTVIDVLVPDASANNPAEDINSSSNNVCTRQPKGILKKPDAAKHNRRICFDPMALLLDAALEGELELVKRSAQEVKNVSLCNDEGITALHNAICAGHYEIVRYLIEADADVNAQDSDGWTPLHCAASCNNLPMVKYLVEHGACIFATTISDHETPADKCEEEEDGFDGCSQFLFNIQEKFGIINSNRVFAAYDYQSSQHDDELTFQDGDELTVLKRDDQPGSQRGWWWCSKQSCTGYVPRNYLALYPRKAIQRKLQLLSKDVQNQADVKQNVQDEAITVTSFDNLILTDDCALKVEIAPEPSGVTCCS